MHDGFFNSSVRSRIVDFILRRKKFEEDRLGHISTGIEKLLSDGTYEAAYPIHEVNKSLINKAFDIHFICL